MGRVAGVPVSPKELTENAAAVAARIARSRPVVSWLNSTKVGKILQP